MTTREARRAAVIDIGKTNAKVCVVELDSFAEIAVRKRPNTAVRGEPYPHYDIDGLWSFILDALGALNRDHPIDAVVTTTHGAAAVLLDAQGELALPVLDYEHDRPEALAADYDAIRPSFAETGSPRLPAGLNLAAQIFWQQRRFPEAFAKVAAILTYPQYWSFRLSGVAANEITSLGAHSDLWSPAARDYSGIVDRLGWRRLFAPIRRAGDSLGFIRPDIAALTGLGTNTLIYCGLHDSNASLLPHLLSRPQPFSVVSTGTWVIAMAITGAIPQLASERDTLINVDAFGGAVPSARFMGGREHDMLMRGPDVTPFESDVAAVLAAKAMLLPSVQAGSGPFPGRQAQWRGEDGLSPGQRQAAVSFYLALMTATCLDLIAADGPTVVEGPFIRNEPYQRMLAAASGRPVLPNAGRTTGTSIGAALLISPHASPPRFEGAAVINGLPDWVDYARAWRGEVGR